MRQLKILIPLLLCLIAAHDVDAQRRHSSRYSRQVIRAYPVLGATASQMRGDELRGFRKWGFTGGVGAEVSLSKDDMWNLIIEADYSQRGAYNNTHDPYALFGLSLDYVDIPISILFTDPYGGITIGAGLMYSRLVRQPHGTIFCDTNYFIPDTSDMTFLPNDLCFALDLRFPIWRSLIFNIRWQHSLFPVKREWHFTEHHNATASGIETWANDLYNSSISIRLLYKFGDDSRRHKKRIPSKNNVIPKRK